MIYFVTIIDFEDVENFSNLLGLSFEVAYHRNKQQAPTLNILKCTLVLYYVGNFSVVR
jgi:hypothetical protein